MCNCGADAFKLADALTKALADQEIGLRPIGVSLHPYECRLAITALRAYEQPTYVPLLEPTEVQVQAGAVILATTPVIDAPRGLSHQELMGLSRAVLKAAMAVK